MKHNRSNKAHVSGMETEIQQYGTLVSGYKSSRLSWLENEPDFSWDSDSPQACKMERGSNDEEGGLPMKMRGGSGPRQRGDERDHRSGNQHAVQTSGHLFRCRGRNDDQRSHPKAHLDIATRET